ncbi:MAG: carotenoid biosynthesis protein [Deltaproteobacteria bacterium]|nr:carotenoid biosynthesis protein [Deltaproteobacteria bacterium]
MSQVTENTLVAAAPGSFALARAELWRHLPAWMFFIYACLLLNTELTNLDPPRKDLAPTVVFPLVVFVLLQTVRATAAARIQWRLLGVSLALAFGLPLLTFGWHRPSPIAPSTMLAVYEWSNFAWAGLLLAHALAHERTHALLFFAVAFVYGALLENGGILLGFFHESHLTRTIVPPLVAPVATMIGWSVVLSMATFVVWELRARLPWLRRSAALSALAVALCATLLDLQIDPLATATGCWVWHASLPPWFYGVPRVNFIAWMCALFPFSYVMFRLQDRLRIADGGRWDRRALVRLLAWVPGALLLAALAFIATTLVFEGANGPSWTILNTFAARL